LKLSNKKNLMNIMILAEFKINLVYILKKIILLNNVCLIFENNYRLKIICLKLKYLILLFMNIIAFS